MTDLKRLTRAGQHLITDDFVRGIVTDLSEEEAEPYLEEVDVDVDLDSLNERLLEIEDDHDEYEEKMDAAAAPEVHRHLELSRRLASDPGIWHYLASFEFEHYVRHRWKYNPEEPSAMREKFLKAGTDIYSNAIHRLWWIAELTVEPDSEDPYARTRRVLANQTLANKIFDRWFSRYEPAAKVVTDVLLEEVESLGPEDPSPTTLVEEVTSKLRKELTKNRLEGMTEEEIEREVRQLVRVERGAESYETPASA